jgi:S-DNA-T family DNA segregation ATPase FtsK/SpoIIIE
MLFLQPGTGTLIRAQGTYARDGEISRVVEHLECDPCYAHELLHLSTAGTGGKGQFLENLRARDELYEQAIEVVVREGRGSVSLLQREPQPGPAWSGPPEAVDALLAYRSLHLKRAARKAHQR